MIFFTASRAHSSAEAHCEAVQNARARRVFEQYWIQLDLMKLKRGGYKSFKGLLKDRLRDF
jgi:hypothetical protein